jgi:hypothetical protein
MWRIRLATRRACSGRLVLWIVAEFLVAAIRAEAQNSPPDAVRLRGRMVDTAGRAIAGVRLQLLGSARGTESDSLGLFVFDSLTAGFVAVAFAHPQFSAVTLELPLTAGDTTIVPVIMVAPDEGGDTIMEPGMLVGVVTDQRGRRLSGADILVATSGQTARTDTLGRFLLHGLSPTRHLLKVRKLGYYVQYLTVTSGSSNALRASIAMEAMGTTLTEIVVRADRIAPRLKAFRERAAHNGWGQFVTRDEILEHNWNSVSDMLAHMRGVTMGTDAMNRVVPTYRGCPMKVLLDGQPLEVEGVSLNSLVALNDLAGVEVYPRGMDAPLEFAFGPLRNLACGVVVFWTR